MIYVSLPACSNKQKTRFSLAVESGFCCPKLKPLPTLMTGATEPNLTLRQALKRSIKLF